MPTSVQIPHQMIIRPLIRHKKRPRNGAAIGIGPIRLEQVIEHVNVSPVDRVIKRDHHDLGCVFRGQTPGNIVGVAVTVGQMAALLITRHRRLPDRLQRVDFSRCFRHAVGHLVVPRPGQTRSSRCGFCGVRSGSFQGFETLLRVSPFCNH